MEYVARHVHFDVPQFKKVDMDAALAEMRAFKADLLHTKIRLEVIRRKRRRDEEILLLAM